MQKLPADHEPEQTDSQPVSHQDLYSKRRSRPLIYALNKLLITFSFALLAGIVVSLVVRGFSVSSEIGVRGLAAAALPPIIITYATLFSRSSIRLPQQLSEVGLFFFSAVWLMLLMLVINYVDVYFSGIPLGVVLSSLSFSFLVYLSKHLPFASMLSCSYGIVSGMLLYTLLFGFSVG